MMTGNAMNADQLEAKSAEAAKLLELMAHPQRMRILCALHDAEWSVVRLAEMIGMSQPNLSHHLKKLRDGGIVRTRRDAQTIYYSLQGRAVVTVLAALHSLFCGSVDADGTNAKSENAAPA
jgi:ArsR family transcriptional regulator, virulence genes transcriptional regulator